MVRGREEISGICIGAVERKVSAYADNLLFYLSNPRLSLAVLMSEVDRYRLMSDFKIHFEKSVLLPIHVPPDVATSLQWSFPFIWRLDYLLYLGVYITPDPRLLYDLNYSPLLTRIMKELQG